MEIVSENGLSRLSLRENQVPHFHRLTEIIGRSHAWMDGSPMGTGKTWITGALAIHFGMPLHVICPRNVKPVWISMAKAIGVDVTVYSYDAFRGSRRHQPTSGLLFRQDTQVTIRSGRLAYKVEFFSTSKLRDLVEKGVLFVFDEAHRMKRKSSQFYAGEMIAKMILSSEKGLSRVGLLSGTMYDKKKHCIQFLHLIGYVLRTDPKDNKDELIEVCNHLNPTETRKALALSDNLTDVLYNLYVHVVLKHIASVAEPPPLKIDVMNGFYHMSPSGVKDMIEALDELQKRDKSESNIARFNRALMKIEYAKLPTMARLGKDILDTQPMAKVILFVNYSESIKYLGEVLKDYNPLKFYGGIKEKVRQSAIVKFQTPSVEHRLLLISISSGSVGLSLHDTDGHYPRYVFGIPRFAAIDMQQATYRVFRDGMKSPASVKYIYDIKTGDIEVSLIDALARKSSVMEDQVLDNKGKIVFPGSYPVYRETKKPRSKKIRKSRVVVPAEVSDGEEEDEVEFMETEHD